MNNLQDAIYNWLTIKVVCMERPTDTAAAETEKMFFNLLLEQHQISNINVEKTDTMYNVTYQKDELEKQYRFPKEMVEFIINQINADPEKYKSYQE